VLSYPEGEEVAQVAPTSVATSRFCERALQLNYVWNVSTSIVHTNKLNRCEMEYASKSGAYSNKDQYQLVGMFRDRATAMEQALVTAQTYKAYFTKSPKQCKLQLKAAEKFAEESNSDNSFGLDDETHEIKKPMSRWPNRRFGSTKGSAASRFRWLLHRFRIVVLWIDGRLRGG